MMPEQTSQEKTELSRIPKRKKRAKPIRYKAECEQGVSAIRIEEASREQMFETTGLTTPMAGQMLLSQVLGATPWVFRGETMEKDVESLNRQAEMMHSIAPKDGVEGMLAAQMVACNNMAMECLHLAMGKGVSSERADQYLKYANKFMRTFTDQVVTLTKYRTRGQQVVQVQHVQVNQGGQAVIGQQA